MCSNTFVNIYYLLGTYHGARMEAEMRRGLFSHFQRLSFSYYDKHNTGEMMSKLISDLFDISELAHHGPENLFISILKIARINSSLQDSLAGIRVVQSFANEKVKQSNFRIATKPF